MRTLLTADAKSAMPYRCQYPPSYGELIVLVVAIDHPSIRPSPTYKRYGFLVADDGRVEWGNAARQEPDQGTAFRTAYTRVC